jgi:hypothetical protein
MKIRLHQRLAWIIVDTSCERRFLTQRNHHFLGCSLDVFRDDSQKQNDHYFNINNDFLALIKRISDVSIMAREAVIFRDLGAMYARLLRIIEQTTSRDERERAGD